MACLFCSIVDRSLDAAIVHETDHTIAFLDRSPVFPGHVLVIPKLHAVTLTDLPADLVGPVFAAVQHLAGATQEALAADGTWVSMNNTVSQSVPHLHVHVVPRRRKDGLRGFYWPRQKYASDEEMQAIAASIRDAARQPTDR